MASNHGTNELNFFFKVFCSLKHFIENLQSPPDLSSSSQESSEAKNVRMDAKSLYDSVMEALKAPDLTHERNTVLHVALQGDYRLPE